MDIIMGIIALVLTLVIGMTLAKWGVYKKLTPLQKAYRRYKKTKLGNDKERAAAEDLNRLIIAELVMCSSSRELKKKFGSMAYWCNQNFNSKDGLPVVDFFNTRFAELIEREDTDRDRLLAESERETNEREAESMKRAQDATSVEEARDAYEKAPRFEDSRQLALEKWEWLSLVAVLNVKTIEELHKVQNDTPSGSLAKKLAPYMHEYISRIEVETATSVKDLVEAGNTALQDVVFEQTALHICFQKLLRLLRAQPITIKKVF